MILAVDIGNTTMTMGVVDRARILRTQLILTTLSRNKLKSHLQRAIYRIRKSRRSIETVIICSVVPDVLKVVKPVFRRFFNKVLVVGKDLKVPIKNRYHVPQQVGQDRLVGAYATIRLYGKPAIVVDFGTAITFDVISETPAYLGGAIVPGLRLYAESLFEKTALLPKVKIRPPTDVMGKDTTSSILSGIFYGYGSLCEGMIAKLSRQFKRKPIVVATGGNAELMKGYVFSIDKIDRDLILKGMALLVDV